MFNYLFTLPFERRCEIRINLKCQIWHCPLSYLIRYSFDTDSALFRGKGKQCKKNMKEVKILKKYGR